MEAVYEKLAAFLDKLPGGYPRTESGVELRILQKLFTPQEAELALQLTLIEEEARVVAFRAHRPVEQVAQMLDDMEHKGLVLGSHVPGQPDRYAASQFFIGLWEGQVHRLDRELVELVDAYIPAFQQNGLYAKLPQLRTIPVGVSIPITTEVMPYMRAEAIIRKNRELAVTPCVCRKAAAVKGEGCGRPIETCLTFGSTAHNAIHTGFGRAISQDEALSILHRAEAEGMVLQPANSQDPMSLCACCGCCCGILTYLKTQARPADLVANPFMVQHNPETCTGCGLCLDRCQMDAITLPGGVAQHHPERCIGCGLCVNTCPTGSLTLVYKPAGKQPSIPRSTFDTYLRLSLIRDRLIAARWTGQLVKSRIDRLVAPRTSAADRPGEK